MIDDWLFMFPHLSIFRYWLVSLLCLFCQYVFLSIFSSNHVFLLYIMAIVQHNHMENVWILTKGNITLTKNFEVWVLVIFQGGLSNKLGSFNCFIWSVAWCSSHRLHWRDLRLTLTWKCSLSVFAHSIGISKKHIKLGLNAYDALPFHTWFTISIHYSCIKCWSISYYFSFTISFCYH